MGARRIIKIEDVAPCAASHAFDLIPSLSKDQRPDASAGVATPAHAHGPRANGNRRGNAPAHPRKGTTDMARKKKTEIEYSPECEEALERLTGLAHQLAAMLTGD